MAAFFSFSPLLMPHASHTFSIEDDAPRAGSEFPPQPALLNARFCITFLARQYTQYSSISEVRVRHRRWRAAIFPRRRQHTFIWRRYARQFLQSCWVGRAWWRAFQIELRYFQCGIGCASIRAYLRRSDRQVLSFLM